MIYLKIIVYLWGYSLQLNWNGSEARILGILKGNIVPHLISMKIQIWKFENNFELATFYGYLLKNMSCDLFRVL